MCYQFETLFFIKVLYGIAHTETSGKIVCLHLAYSNLSFFDYYWAEIATDTEINFLNHYDRKFSKGSYKPDSFLKLLSEAIYYTIYGEQFVVHRTSNRAAHILFITVRELEIRLNLAIARLIQVVTLTLIIQHICLELNLLPAMSFVIYNSSMLGCLNKIQWNYK